MTREKAIKIVKEFISGTCLHLVDQEALETLIPELKESEDDRMIRLLRKLGSLDAAEELYEEFDISYVKVVYWLAKRSVNNEYVFRPSAGTDITIAAEQAIRRTKEGDHLVLAFNGVYLPVRKYNNAKELVDEYDAYIEKQKDASKAIEAVERIDKYIDEHLANAHDMKDSNPDKKYYRGWDDALGKIAGILQDVYSGEKQKEPQEIPLMNGDVDLYFDEWNQQNQNPTKRQCFEEGMKYAHRLQKEQKPVEWSEEDEEMIRSILFVLESYVSKAECEQSPALTATYPTYYKEIDWLKSLRPSWKPSEEQMEALKHYVDTTTDGEIELLYNDLKKLM